MSLFAPKPEADKKKADKKGKGNVEAEPVKLTERERDAQRKRETRAKAKTVEIPACANRRRRNRLEKDDAAWLRWYFPDLFWYAFTEQQTAMIKAVSRAIDDGGDDAEAASRGEGKSTIGERLSIKKTLQGKLKFVLLCHANGRQGRRLPDGDQSRRSRTTIAWRPITRRSASRSGLWNKRPTEPITRW